MSNAAFNQPIYLNDLGIVNALGCGQAEVLQNFLAATAPGMVHTAGWLPEKNIVLGEVQAMLPSVPTTLAHHDSRTNQLLLCALQQMQARLDAFVERYGKQRIGVVIGTSTSGIAEGEGYIAGLLHGETNHYHYRKQEMGAPGLFLAEYLQLTGPCLTVSTACSSSAKVFATARNWLSLGLCDVVIAGGADSLCRLTVEGFHALGLVSDQKCRPFQSGRNGINIGEAAALFLLSRDLAPVRLRAVGESSDAYHISAPQPEGEGAESAMCRALREANLTAADIDYINLHGTATPANDSAESAAVSRVFAAAPAKVSSSKPLTGHTLGAAGATEAGLCWLLMSKLNQQAIFPAQAGLLAYDPSLPAINMLTSNFIFDKSASLRALSNSFAFGGSNVSLILEKQGATQYSLEQLLPHRAPMLLLDSVQHCSLERAEVQVVISAQSAFYSEENTGVPLWVGIEYMAQAIGVWEGFRKLSNKQVVQAAFLLAARDYQTSCQNGDHFPLGARLSINVIPAFYDEEKRLGVFDCTITAEGLQCKARINAYSPLEPDKFIEMLRNEAAE
jgi:3-oxoacyl-[acyl-carrier-protein] synthase-1